MAHVEYMRCPVCGKLSRPDNFAQLAYGGHMIGVWEQEFGGRGVCSWALKTLTDHEYRDLCHVLLKYLELAGHWVTLQLNAIELRIPIPWDMTVSHVPVACDLEVAPIEVRW